MRRVAAAALSILLVAGTFSGSESTASSSDAVHPSFTAQGGSLVRLQVGAFDPLADELPSQPGIPLVSEDELPTGVMLHWLVQVAGDDFAGARTAVEAAGGTIRSALPDDVYVVAATAEQRQAFDAAPSIRWTGYLQPSWKVPVAANGEPGVMELDGVRTLQVVGYRGAGNFGHVTDALRTLTGVDVLDVDDPVAVVRASRTSIPDIAAIEGVQWVTERASYQTFNADARWVTDTGVRDLYRAVDPDGGHLTGAGQTAAVADTGVNYVPDANGLAHTAFRDCPSYPDDCKLADYTQKNAGTSFDPADEEAAVVVDHATDHRKIAAYFDLGGGGVNPADLTAHGTHTAGSVGADYGSDGEWQGHDGMAAAARLVIQQISDESGSLAGLPTDLYDLFRQAYRPRDPLGVPDSYDPADYANYVPTEDARTHNNSWGSIVPVAETGDASATDAFVWDHEDMAVVISAGNAGPAVGSAAEPAVAKNDLTSAASDNGRLPGSSIDTLAHFSSHGPTADGRLYVDLATPGQIVISPKGGSEDVDHYLQGTSMSAPILTGLATLTREYFFEGFGPADGRGFAAGSPDPSARRHNPSAALVKAALVNGAVRMRGWYTGDDGSAGSLDGQYPSRGQGFGLVNLDNSLFFEGDTTNNWFYDVWRADDEAFAAGAGDTRTFEVTVPEGNTEPFEVSLVWSDAPGALTTGTPVLVNDLDLTVAGPGGSSYHGNVFNTRGTPSADEYHTMADTPAAVAAPTMCSVLGAPTNDCTNNVEKVRILDPETGVAPAGTYTITVSGTRVMEGPQGFALAARGVLSDAGPAGSTASSGFAAGDGTALQQDASGAPSIVTDSVSVERYSADTSIVRFETTEPTTARIVGTVAGEEQEFVDFTNAANGSWFTEYYQPGDVETSDAFGNRPVASTEHEIFVYGTDAGQTYDLTIEATDLGDNTTTAPLELTASSDAFQPLAPDMGNLAEAAQDPAVDTVPLLSGSGWQTMTQFYVGTFGGSGYLGAFMFRLPESVDPDDIVGAAVEVTGSYEFASRYGPEEVVTVDLLDESVEPEWGTQTYTAIDQAGSDARLNPESSVLHGGITTQAFSFPCTSVEALKETLSTTNDEGERLAAFRLDVAGLTESDWLAGFESGFNRRSHGPHLRPRLVLLTDESADHLLPGGCDPSTPAPTIEDVEVSFGVDETSDDPVVDRTEVAVTWETDVPSDSVVIYREQGTDEWQQVGTPVLTRRHVVQVSNLDPQKQYEFGVRSRACNGEATTDDNDGAGYSFYLNEVDPPTDFTEHAVYTFDSSLDGWTVEVGGLGGAIWRPDAYGDPGGAAAVAPYGSQSSSTLTAPEAVTFGADGENPLAQLFFTGDIATEKDFDFVHVEYQLDGEDTWTRVASLSGPRDALSGSTNFKEPGFDEYVFNLTEVPFGTPVTFRFVFESDFFIDSSQGYRGAWVDNVTMRTGVGGDLTSDPTDVTPPHPAPSAEGDIDLSTVATQTSGASTDEQLAGTSFCVAGASLERDPAAPGDGEDPLPATGGGASIVGMLLLSAGGAIALRRRRDGR